LCSVYPRGLRHRLDQDMFDVQIERNARLGEEKQHRVGGNGAPPRRRIREGNRGSEAGAVGRGHAHGGRERLRSLGRCRRHHATAAARRFGRHIRRAVTSPGLGTRRGGPAHPKQNGHHKGTPSWHHPVARRNSHYSEAGADKVKRKILPTACRAVVPYATASFRSRQLAGRSAYETGRAAALLGGRTIATLISTITVPHGASDTDAFGLFPRPGHASILPGPLSPFAVAPRIYASPNTAVPSYAEAVISLS